MSIPSPESPTTPTVTPRKRGPLIQRVVEVVISLGFLFLALRGIRLKELWLALQQANYWWLIPCVLITVALLFLKGWRWQLLFLPEYRLPYSPVFTSMCAGYLASNVLPGRAGELVRLVLLVSEEQVSAARTLSTIVVERLLDILTLLVILVLMLPFVKLPSEMMRGAQALGILALAGAIIMVVLSFWKERVLGWAHAILGRVKFLDRPGIYAALGHLIDGFATLRGRLGLLADRAFFPGLGRCGRDGVVGCTGGPSGRTDHSHHLCGGGDDVGYASALHAWLHRRLSLSGDRGFAAVWYT